MPDFTLTPINASYAIAMACITYKTLPPEQQKEFSEIYDEEFNRAADHFNLRREQFKEANDNTHLSVVLSAFHASFNKPTYKRTFEENVMDMFVDPKVCESYRALLPEYIQVKEPSLLRNLFTLGVDRDMGQIEDITEEFLASDVFYESLNHKHVSKMKEYVQEVLPLVQSYRTRHGLKPLDVQIQDIPKAA
jgi:hypothetical protein